VVKIKIPKANAGPNGNPEFVFNDQARVIDERGGRSFMGIPVGRALADAYEFEHEDERVFKNEDSFIIYPE
jgi:hypothetical protein